MDIQESDFSQVALKTASAISEGVDMLARFVAAGKYESPEIDKLLVALLMASRSLLDYIAPLKSTGEIHGLPKPFTDASDRPEPIIYRKDDPSIDFGPWWLEKTSRIHTGLFKIAADLSCVNTDTEKSLMNLNVAEVKRLTYTIVDMLNSGGLIIKDIMLSDSED